MLDEIVERYIKSRPKVKLSGMPLAIIISLIICSVVYIVSVCINLNPLKFCSLGALVIVIIFSVVYAFSSQKNILYDKSEYDEKKRKELEEFLNQEELNSPDGREWLEQKCELALNRKPGDKEFFSPFLLAIFMPAIISVIVAEEIELAIKLNVVLEFTVIFILMYAVFRLLDHNINTLIARKYDNIKRLLYELDRYKTFELKQRQINTNDEKQ